MQQIEKIERNEHFITFHSLKEMRVYKLSVYQNHIIDYAFKHVCDNCDFGDWSLDAIIEMLSDCNKLDEFNELFTTQLDGLIEFKGKSTLKSKKIPVLNEIGEYKNTNKEYQYSVQLLEFENGIKGRYFLNRSVKNINPTEGSVYEFAFKLELGKYDVKTKSFIEYRNIKLTQSKKVSKKQLIHA